MKQKISPVVDNWHSKNEIKVLNGWYPFDIDKLGECAIQVATPEGLISFNTNNDNCIIANQPLLVMSEWDEDLFWNWLTTKINSCASHELDEFIRNVCKYFNWEYDYHLEEERLLRAQQQVASLKDNYQPTIKRSYEESSGESLRAWWPDDSLCIDIWITIEIEKATEYSFMHKIRTRVVTPSALVTNNSKPQILAKWPVVVISEWDGECLWNWVRKKIDHAGKYIDEDYFEILERDFERL